MATSALDHHNMCRTKVCVVCYRKGKRSLSAGEVEFIQLYLIDGYTTDNSDFPSAICETCHFIVNKKQFEALPRIESYDPKRPLLLRDSVGCTCEICKIAKTTIFPRKKKNKGGRPQKHDRPSILKICSKCFTPVNDDRTPHGKCASKRVKLDNVQELLSVTPTTSQRVASRIIKETTTPFLSTLSKPLPLLQNSTKKQLFSVDDMSKIQNDLSLSNTQMETLAQDLRATSGSRNVIESKMKLKLREKNRQLSDFFEEKMLLFVNQNLKENTRENFREHAVICNDLNSLIDKIIEERYMDEDDMLIRIGMDGGGGFVKICLSVFGFNSGEEGLEYGGRLKQRFKDSGVKRVMIIAIVPDIQENYINIKRLWYESGIDNLTRPYTIATDLKLCNIILGLMSHSSNHPCCWCDITKGNLDKKGHLRTIKSLTDLYFNFFDARADRNSAKDYGNVIHPPMLANNEKIDDSTLILLLVPPPELHLLLGPVNTLFDEMSKVWGDGSEWWIQKLNIKREEYHGGAFNGNDSRKMLKNIDLLETLSVNSHTNIQGFIKAYRTFNEVVVACDGTELQPDYNDKIKKFRLCYKQLKISITPKVHAVFHHVGEFCELTKKSLGPFSEQTAESLHSDFTKIWNNYKVRATDHDEYGKRLLDAVIAYNSQHL